MDNVEEFIGDQIAVRQWTSADVAEVAGMVRELHTWTDQTYNGPFALADSPPLALGQIYAALQSDFDNRSGTVFVAAIPEQLVGICQISHSQGLSYKHPVRYTEIRNVYVKMNYRTSGVGKRLVSEAVAWSRRNVGNTPIVLYVDHSNTRAIEFYQSMGFELRHSVLAF